MKRFATILIAFVLLFIQGTNLFSQTRGMDSLNILLGKATQDTTRLRLYLTLCDSCPIKDNLKYAEPAIKLADKLLAQTSDTLKRNAVLKRKADAYNFMLVYYRNTGRENPVNELMTLENIYAIYTQIHNLPEKTNTLIDIADYYFRKGDILKQLEVLMNGLDISRKENNKRGESRFIVQIGLLYSFQGDTINALDYLEKGNMLEKEIGDSTRYTKGQFLTGMFYFRMKKYKKAIEYFKKALELTLIRNDVKTQPPYYLQLGQAQLFDKDYENARINFNLVYEKAIAISDLKSQFLSMIALGNVETGAGNFKKAIEKHQECYKLVKPFNDPSGIAVATTALSKDYYASGDLKKAKQYLEESLEMTQKQGALIDKMNLEELAYKIDSASGIYRDAYYHYTQFIRYNNQFLNEEVHKAAARGKFQNELQKQKVVAQLEQDKKDALAKKEKQQKDIVIYAVCGGLSLVLLLAIFILRGYRQKQKANLELLSKNEIINHQKHLVEEKNQEIVDSITYAKRLQHAILPPLTQIHHHLPDSFLLYRPKDIVAGDFYWMHTSGDSVLIAAADCTGHGVPGALVSIVCSNALNRTVKEFGLSDTGKILDKVTELVLETFELSGEEINDGMDISLLAINRNSGKIQWSGANNPLWIVRGAELSEIKADKQPIGKSEDRTPFKTHALELVKGESFYLITDGYADQFGPDDKKMMKKRFKELILSVQDKTMQEQETILDEHHVSWKGGMEQTDDVTVIGIRI
jgi:serine phosphatase RsbU (regulator of sigma subunit)